MSLFTSLIPTRNRSVASGQAAVDEQASVAETISPRYEVRETDEAFALTVQLAGVNREGLELTAEDNEIRVFGRRTWQQPEGWAPLYRETSDAAYELVLTHEGSVDVDRIHAVLADGVLQVSLPKAEAVKPRKIAVS